MSNLFILPVDSEKGFFYRIESTNGEIMVVSEMFSSKWNRNRACRRLSSETGLEVRPADRAS